MNEENTDVAQKRHHTGMVKAVHFQHIVLETVIDRSVESRVLQKNDGLKKGKTGSWREGVVTED